MGRHAIIVAIVVAIAALVFLLYTFAGKNLLVNSFEECALRGYPVMESYPRQCKAGNRIFVEQINAQFNDQNGEPGNEIVKEANIIVSEPIANQEVVLPLRIRGRARVFEAVFNYRVKDEDGTALYENHGMAVGPDAGQFGQFDVLVHYPAPQGKIGTVEVFDYSAKDGSEQDKVIIPVRFKADVEAISVRAYFSSRTKDPDTLHCETTYPVIRRVPKTSAVARVALEELFKGPAAMESDGGYFTSINPGVAIQKLEVKNGIAYADFSDMLGVGVGGSCRVTAIRSQITQTLKQFPTVSNVIISINGKTKDILQP